MREDISNQIPSDCRTNDAARHPIKSTDRFLHKPAGVFLICLLLFGLTVWTFAPALKADFQYFDEGGELLDNNRVNSGISWQSLRWAFSSLEYSNWFPLTWISHMLDFKMYGAHPWGHHLTNVLLHAANGILLFLVLKRMTGALWRSLIVAGLFALHPLHVEPVAWISERKDVLSTTFWLLAMWTYARFADESRTPAGRPGWFYGLTLLFFALGLMSKQMVVTLPFVFLLLDFWPLNRWHQNKWKLILEKIPFFALMIAASIVAYVAKQSGNALQEMTHLPLGDRAGNALISYVRYLGKFFWPENLCLYYPHPGHWPTMLVLLAALFVVGVSALAWMKRKQIPYLFTGWFWYLGALVPVIGLVQLHSLAMADVWVYVPLIGIILIPVWGLSELTKSWRHRTVLLSMIAGVVMVVCALLTRHQIGFWKDGVTVWRHAIAVTKDNYVAHYCLGYILSPANPGEALAEYQKSVDIYPGYFDAQLGLGAQLQNAGRLSDAIVPFEKAILLKPEIGWGYGNLGFVLLKLGRAKDAVPPMLKAAELDPRDADYKEGLNMALYSSPREIDAVSNLLAIARSDPAGFGHFLEAMQFDTNHVILINNMACSFATYPDSKLRNGEYAVRLATRACEMTGFKSAFCVGTLGVAYAEASRFDEAISSAQLACSLASAAGLTDLLKENQDCLELFRSHQPYHASIK